MNLDWRIFLLLLYFLNYQFSWTRGSGVGLLFFRYNHGHLLWLRELRLSEEAAWLLFVLEGSPHQVWSLLLGTSPLYGWLNTTKQNNTRYWIMSLRKHPKTTVRTLNKKWQPRWDTGMRRWGKCDCTVCRRWKADSPEEKVIPLILKNIHPHLAGQLTSSGVKTADALHCNC